jgi:hypothetical protein
MGYRLELGTRVNSSWLQTPEVHYVLENIGSKLISWSMKYNGSFSSQSVALLRNLSNLRFFELYHCHQITEQVLKSLFSLPCLCNLYLNGCTNITDTALALLPPLDSLQQLELVGCTKITDEGVASLVKHTNIHTLYLDNCQITTWGVALLAANLTSLHTLILSRCSNLPNMHSLARLPGMQTIQLVIPVYKN